MKTILIALIGWCFASGSVAAQTKNCESKKKTADLKENGKNTRKTNVNVKHRPTLRECPSGYAKNYMCIYDSLGNVEYIVNRAFAGNYPDNTESVNPGFRQLTVTSPAFTNFGVMPMRYTCDGAHASPPLSIGNIPQEARSLAVIMHDRHATESGDQANWLIWDLDTTSFIPENFVNDHMVLNSADQYGYHPVCPAIGRHYYHFTVYALDTKLKGSRESTKASIERAMHGHILARGELVGVYSR